MAFLDNSGDIILDAVLTDVGRKRMAQGDFTISKFAIGDDEIDYQLYNKNHPSGSAYYDLEILQTPVLEAFTQTNASINYGLTTFANQNLFYLPSIALNEKSFGGSNAIIASTGVIYLADDSGPPTSTAIPRSTSQAIENDFTSTTNVVLSSGNPGRAILIETGIDTPTVLPTPQKQSELIISNGLLDNNFTVSYDERFIESVGYSTGPTFQQTAANTIFVPGSMTFEDGAVGAMSIDNYKEVTVPGFTTQVFARTSGSPPTDGSVLASAIRGPRGSHCVINFRIKASLTEQSYIEFGSVNRTQNGGSQLYDFIDTNVYVRGQSTGTTITLPIRIIAHS